MKDTVTQLKNDLPEIDPMSDTKKTPTPKAAAVKKTPVKKAPVKKAPVAKEPMGPGTAATVTLRALAEKAKIPTAAARRALRTEGIEKPGASWRWSQEDAQVSKIQEILEKLAA